MKPDNDIEFLNFIIKFLEIRGNRLLDDITKNEDHIEGWRLCIDELRRMRREIE